jgi:DNA polymerase
MKMRKEILSSLKEHLLFLSESGIREIAISGRGPARPPAGGEPETGSIPADEGLEAVRLDLGDCQRCALAGTRRHIVFGEGDPNAEILFVGEGPGEDEDRTGRPFVGRAGELLTQIIEKGMKLRRSDVYICNIVKCRPPGNRDPREEETAACMPFLKKQIQAVRPRVIITLGRPAAHALLEVQEPMTRLRGKWHSYDGIPLMPIFHPAYVLRQYTVPIRRQVYEDTLEVLRLLEEST